MTSIDRKQYLEDFAYKNVNTPKPGRGAFI